MKDVSENEKTDSQMLRQLEGGRGRDPGALVPNPHSKIKTGVRLELTQWWKNRPRRRLLSGTVSCLSTPAGAKIETKLGWHSAAAAPCGIQIPGARLVAETRFVETGSAQAFPRSRDRAGTRSGGWWSCFHGGWPRVYGESGSQQLGDDEIHHDYAPHRGFRSPVAAEAAQLQPMVGLGYLPLFAFYPLSAFGLVPRALINTRIAAGDPSSCNSRTRKLLNSQISHWHQSSTIHPTSIKLLLARTTTSINRLSSPNNLFSHTNPPKPNFQNDWRRQVWWQGLWLEERAIVS